MESTEIFFDTNFLRCKDIRDFSNFRMSKIYENFIDFLGSNDLIEMYNINISEITINEIKQQIIREYKDTVKDICNIYEKLKNVHNIKIDTDNLEYEQHLEKVIVNYTNYNKINVIQIPKNINLFENIINRAIHKQKPFLGEEKESDKGFKDALLWECIIDYANKSSAMKFILMTKNKNDFPKNLEEEFNELTGKSIKIYYDIYELQDTILEDNNLINTSTLTFDKLKQYELKDKINTYFIENNRNLEIENIIKIDNFVNEGNDLYIFDIYDRKNEYPNDEMRWSVEITFKDNDIRIDDVIGYV